MDRHLLCVQTIRSVCIDRDAGRHASVLRDLTKERDRQEELREAGRFKSTCANPAMSPFEKLAVLGEEFGEVSRALLEMSGNANDKTGVKLREELIQVAAVAVAWAESLS